MKISVCLPTKNRPVLLMSVLTAFDQLSSGKHEITYQVGVDEGDEASMEAFKMANVSGAAHIVSRETLTIGGIWNYLAKQHECDIYLAHVDDAIPLLRYWDEAIVAYMPQHLAFSWSDSELGNQAGYPIISKEWLKASGVLCVEHFPFWFCDTWFEELYQFTFNRKIVMPPSLAVAGKRGETNNLHDLDFWWGFFNATRRIRLSEAFRISKELNVSVQPTYKEFVKSREQWLSHSTKRDVHFKKLIPQLEVARLDKREPTEKYLNAKAVAERYLNERGLKIWSCMPEELPLAAE